jgi:hypothetical protein
MSICGPQKEIQAKVTVLFFSLLRSKKRRAIKENFASRLKNNSAQRWVPVLGLYSFLFVEG